MQSVIMKIYKFLLLCFIVSLSFSSCSSDNEDEIYEVYYMKLLPAKITNNEGQEISYSYDANDRLTEILYKPVNESAEYSAKHYRIRYTDNNYIDSLYIDDLKYTKSKTDTISDTLVFVYEDMSVSFDYNEGTKVIQIDSSGRLVYQEIEDEESNTTYDYEYATTDTRNIASVTIGKEPSSEQVIQYTYDEKKGAFKNVRTPQWFLVSFFDVCSGFTNNIVSEGNTTYSYTYSDNNYPRERRSSKGYEETIGYTKAMYYK